MVQLHILYDQCCLWSEAYSLDFWKITSSRNQSVRWNMNQLPYVVMRKRALLSWKWRGWVSVTLWQWGTLSKTCLLTTIGNMGNITIIHPLMRDQPETGRQVNKLCSLVPQVIPEDEVDTVVTRWMLYTDQEIPRKWFIHEDTPAKTTYNRINHYWHKVLSINNTAGNLTFGKLGTLVRSFLCIAHGNADVERPLSHNKNTICSAWCLTYTTSQWPRIWYKIASQNYSIRKRWGKVTESWGHTQERSGRQRWPGKLTKTTKWLAKSER